MESSFKWTDDDYATVPMLVNHAVLRDLEEVFVPCHCHAKVLPPVPSYSIINGFTIEAVCWHVSELQLLDHWPKVLLRKQWKRFFVRPVHECGISSLLLLLVTDVEGMPWPSVQTLCWLSSFC